MKTRRIHVLGMVQGVGYRPFVARLCEELGLTGFVVNNGGIVEMTVTGEEEVLETLVRRLSEEAPPNARVDQVLRTNWPLRKFATFSIGQSETSSKLPPLIPPDLPTCPRCERELMDPSNRRYRHPFISCVSCGPRYSILRALPYDRCHVTMEDFPLCPACEKEYTGQGNIRRHAQTIACHDCGPILFLDTAQGKVERETALQQGAALLKAGAILAVKDIGGYHLACDPHDSTACARLRLLKGRERKPFAVLFPDVETIKAYCFGSSEEIELLCSNPRPIALLKKRPGRDFASECCGDSHEIGAMLPCNPVQILLSQACGPLVMTSANRSGEPIIIDDNKMLHWLRENNGLDGVLWHRRQILTPLDDSVTRVVGGLPQIFRRARGYVPEPVYVRGETEFPILAAGGDLKACFCLLTGNRAYLSQHFGDLQDESVFQTYRREIQRMEKLLGIRPQAVAVDKHPGYLSRQMGETLGLPVIEIQHHHAHVAAVMAECGLTGPVLGVAFDGTGYGDDSTVWGGEFLLCDGTHYQRVGHLDSVTLLGGDEGARNGDTILCGYLRQTGISQQDNRYQTIAAALALGINTVRSSSMGRLFDGAAALLGVRDYNGYEGECAIALENAAKTAESAPPLHMNVTEREGQLLGDGADLLSQLLERKNAGEDARALALAFHTAIAGYVLETARWARERFGVEQIALGGGTFQNRILLETTLNLLERQGFRVYYNHLVPPGDGGLSLGQAWLAAQMGLGQKE